MPWGQVDSNTLFISCIFSVNYEPEGGVSEIRRQEAGDSSFNLVCLHQTPENCIVLAKKIGALLGTSGGRKCRSSVPLTPSEPHASHSLRGRRCATLDMSPAIRMKNWTALRVPSRHAGSVLHLRRPEGGRRTKWDLTRPESLTQLGKQPLNPV